MYKNIVARSLILIVATSCGGQSQAEISQPVEARETFAPTDMLYTPNPAIPQSVIVWGEEVSLDPVERYERLDRELTACTYTHGTTLLTIKRANRYFPIIAPILKKNGIPDDMLYLAVIESNLDERALSPAKAAGIWQFMPATAKQYGLEVNDFVDERYNLEKATEAACRYFKEAYAKFGNWNSVAAAYNGGMARIANELGAQQQNEAIDLYLTTETTRYPYRIMAMKLIMEHPANYGFILTPDQLYQPLDYEEVSVNTPVDSWVDWAKQRGLSYSQLREANPWIRAKSLPNKTGKTYKVKVPTKNSLSRSTQTRKIYNSDWISQ